MEFNQITYFLRTCDTLNFTRAAELCNVSQPSLSAAIKKLENELGGALFTRDGRVIEMTTLGESMRIHLGQIEQAREAANLAASTLVHSGKYVINLGFMCTLSPRRLLSAIASFSDETPNNELLIHDVWQSKALELLLSGALDCIIMAGMSDLAERFVEQRLTEEKMMVAMDKAHPLSNRDRISFSDLQSLHYVDRLRCEFREMFFEELGSRQIEAQVVLRSEREDLVGGAIAESIGISIMPESAAKNADLKTCDLDELSIIRKISIVTVKDRELHPAVHRLIQHVLVAYQ